MGVGTPRKNPWKHHIFPKDCGPLGKGPEPIREALCERGDVGGDISLGQSDSWIVGGKGNSARPYYFSVWRIDGGRGFDTRGNEMDGGA